MIVSETLSPILRGEYEHTCGATTYRLYRAGVLIYSETYPERHITDTGRNGVLRAAEAQA